MDTTFVLLPASGSLLVREIFGTKLTRTGSIAPSVRHKMSRKSDSPFAFFNKKASNQLTRSVSAISEVHVLYVHTHYHINVPTCMYNELGTGILCKRKLADMLVATVCIQVRTYYIHTCIC